MSLYDVKIHQIDDGELPEEFAHYKEDYAGCNILCIYRDGFLMNHYTDHGEIEDNSFLRDYDWIAREIEKAYKIGFADGKREVQSALEHLHYIRKLNE